MSYEDAVAGWAVAKLKEMGKSVPGVVHHVSFGYEHSCCYGHVYDEYCYCDTSTMVEVTVFFGEGRPLKWEKFVTGMELGDIIREVTEF